LEGTGSRQKKKKGRRKTCQTILPSKKGVSALRKKKRRIKKWGQEPTCRGEILRKGDGWAKKKKKTHGAWETRGPRKHFALTTVAVGKACERNTQDSKREEAKEKKKTDC